MLSDSTIMAEEFPRKPPFPAAPYRDLDDDWSAKKDYSRSAELDRKLSAYLDRVPEEKRSVQEMFTRVLKEVSDLKAHVDTIKEEQKDELRGIKARINVLESELNSLRPRVSQPQTPLTPMKQYNSIPPGKTLGLGVSVGESGMVRVDPQRWNEFAKDWEALKAQLNSAKAEADLAKARFEGEQIAKKALTKKLSLAWKIGGPLATGIGALAYHLIKLLLLNQ